MALSTRSGGPSQEVSPADGWKFCASGNDRTDDSWECTGVGSSRERGGEESKDALTSPGVQRFKAKLLPNLRWDARQETQHFLQGLEAEMLNSKARSWLPHPRWL